MRINCQSKFAANRAARFRAANFSCATAIAIVISLALASNARIALAQDDWHVVERHSSQPATAPGAAPRSAQSDGSFAPCGEPARPATEPYKSIVAQLNDMWGTNFPVYESLKPASPHAHDGGCIFYNQEYLTGLLQQWMNISDQDAVRPMLYAIFAHELGHLAHGDFDSGEDNVPLKNKELAADQFAGFSLERVGMRRLDPTEVTQYYQLTGDDFVGRASGHGIGSERTAAFQDGWHRAEIGLPEQSTRPPGGLGEP